MHRNRIKWVVCLLCLWVASINLFAQQKTLPNVAYQDSEVRITMITEGVARLEYVPDGKFVDDKSFVAVNRDYPKVDYQLKNSGKTIEIRTSKMILKYKKNTGKFTANNLSITSVKGKGLSLIHI